MQAWEDFVKKQERALGKEVAEKWLHSLKVVHFDACNLYLEAKDSFHLLWFEEHIRPLLKSQLFNSNFRPVKVHLTAEAPLPPKGAKKTKGALLPPIDFSCDQLDPTMTLEHFVPGEANQVVFRFFCELTGFNPQTEQIETPTMALATFNPIYVWGGEGSGKTHLLTALTHAFKQRGLNARYARAETFTEHVVSAIRGSAMQSFRKAYRHVDVLLIDDVHLLARKHATQEELFHTFNKLHTSSSQIIFASKYAPASLTEIEPRLVSRFEWGINMHFEKLQPDDLKKVLHKRCERLHFPLNDEISHYLVHAFPGSYSLGRALEALILRSHLEGEGHHKRNPRLISLDAAKKMLSDLSTLEAKNALSPEKIIALVSAKYGIRSEDLLGKSQSQECSFPRQIAMYLCRQKLRLSFQGIGRLFSRDHSTVMTSIKQIEKRVGIPDKELLHSLSEIQTSME
jgi:chromosomal replication initiator protein